MFFYIALWGLGDGGQVDNNIFSIYNIIVIKKKYIKPKKISAKLTEEEKK